MSKINEIEQKLLSIDSSRFHKLVNLYLNKKHNYNIQDTWTKDWEDKPIKWTPDTLFPLENWNYIFVEYTTQKTSIVAKFLDDFSKDINEEKTWIPLSKIEKIIFWCNSKLKSDEIETLKNKWLENNINCEILTISSLSYDIFNHYPWIADSELWISIDTRQVLDIEDFIKSNEGNPLSSPLWRDILFRNEKIWEIIESLKNNDITVIHGEPWVWKTKIVIESLKQLQNDSLIIKTLLSKDLKIYDDIQTYFWGDGNYIIFLDDAFRYKSSIIPHLLDLLINKNENRKIKLVFTIRDYAINDIKRIVENYNTNFITINKLEDNEIRKILEQIYWIKNHNFLDKIVRISKWNPRIAVLWWIVSLKDGFNAIQNAEWIYEKYYSWIKVDINSFSEDHGKVIAIVSFFRALDKSNLDLMNNIYDVLKMSEKNFWDIIKELNNFEIFDLYENEIVKVSDQIFSRIFIEVWFLYLWTEFENNYTEWKTFYIQKFPLYITDNLIELRSNIVNHISILYKSEKYIDRITEKILDYIKTSAFNYNDSEILKIDLNVFNNFITENFISSILSDCILVNKLNKKFSNIWWLNKEIINDFLNQENYLLYDLITEDHLDKREDIEYKDFNDYKKQKVINYIDNYKFEEYLSLFEKLRDILNYIKKYDKYKTEIFNNSIKIIFDYIFEKNKDLFLKLFIFCIEKWNFLEISYPDYLISSLLKIISDDELYNLLNNNKYINKEIFIISFFRNLPEEKINSFYIWELLKFYQEDNYIPWVLLDFLIKYHKYEKNIIVDVINEIVTKVEMWENSGYHSLYWLFDPHSDINKNLIMYFNSNLVVLKKVYFICENLWQDADYDWHNLKLINDFDENFIVEYIDFIVNLKDGFPRFDNEDKDFWFLWKDEKNITKIIMHIYNLKIDDFQKARLLIWFFWKFNHSLESINKLEEFEKEFIVSFIQNNITNKALIDFIILLISDFNDEDRLYFIEILIKIDSSLDFFKKIWFKSPSWSLSWSSVNYHTKMKDYYIKIYNILEKKWIHYIEHRLEIQWIIDNLNKIIQHEKRIEFSED